MNLGLFRTQLESVEGLLKVLGLYYAREWHPNYAAVRARDFRGVSYRDAWFKCYTSRYYDFILTDFSILQFRLSGQNPLAVSYSYLECPNRITPYTDFLRSLDFDPETVGDALLPDYELEVPSFPIKAGVTPIRYDYDQERYQTGLHPVSHMHFGYESSIRVGTKRILKPLSFFLFILRQQYRHNWSNLWGLDNTEHLYRNVRESLDMIDQCYLKDQDYWEMMLD